ncbi:MAG TPA: CPBP family glutamic-type intramembrane protease [Thermoanaerobaculia bacterium]|nr:CPBP family glutamic-type intramembrane protease [Thermoanaerobaculia bacterium]
MIVTCGVLALFLAQMWVAAPLFGPVRWTSWLAIGAGLALCVWSNRRERASWGFAREAILPGLGWAALLTLPVVALLFAAGWWLGTLHPRSHLPLRFATLVLWALVQQWVLQTVILREARDTFSRRVALLVAPALFALVHLPNPFLAPATFLAALGWCWVYDRHPNIVPIALSQAAASLTVVLALGPEITGGMRVGYGYFLKHGIWL